MVEQVFNPQIFNAMRKLRKLLTVAAFSLVLLAPVFASAAERVRVTIQRPDGTTIIIEGDKATVDGETTVVV